MKVIFQSLYSPGIYGGININIAESGRKGEGLFVSLAASSFVALFAGAATQFGLPVPFWATGRESITAGVRVWLSCAVSVSRLTTIINLCARDVRGCGISGVSHLRRSSSYDARGCTRC